MEAITKEQEEAMQPVAGGGAVGYAHPEPMNSNEIGNVVEEKIKIHEAFASFACEPHELEHINDIREAFTVLSERVVRNIPDHNGRYKAMVMTKLEEACMIAVKGIARK